MSIVSMPLPRPARALRLEFKRAATPRAAWAQLSIALAGTLCWLLLAFLAGSPCCTSRPLGGDLGLAAAVAGVRRRGRCDPCDRDRVHLRSSLPGRFTAPLVAIGVLVLDQTGLRQALNVHGPSGTYALLSPPNALPVIDTGVYYHVAPDLSITQVMFMSGIAVALFGALGLVAELRQLASARGLASARAALPRGDGWLLHTAAAILVACGVAASWTAFALAGTAKPDAAGGWEMPALHSAASDQPVPVTQDCASSSGFQVCVHPAFSFYLDDLAAAFDPVAAEIAGRPAPRRWRA